MCICSIRPLYVACRLNIFHVPPIYIMCFQLSVAKYIQYIKFKEFIYIIIHSIKSYIYVGYVSHSELLRLKQYANEVR